MGGFRRFRGEQNVDWDDFATVIIRTTWDYQQSPDEFLRALRKIDESKAHLENSLETVEWNLSKEYLCDLESKGVKIVPTIWGEKLPTESDFDSWLDHFQTDEIIIKPIISATAQDTFRLKEFESELSEIFANRRFMIQPFMPKIISEGEFSLFLFWRKLQPYDFENAESKRLSRAGRTRRNHHGSFAFG